MKKDRKTLKLMHQLFVITLLSPILPLRRYAAKIILAVFVSTISMVSAEENSYKLSSKNNSSWWQSKLNSMPWLREKTGSSFKFDRSIAIVVGVGEYEHWDTLPSSAKDADQMAKYLQETGFDEVIVLKDDQAIRSNIDNAISYAEKGLTENDRFLFYWSGHGGRGDNGDGTEFGYLPLGDTLSNGAGNKVSMSEFRNWAQRIPARHTLFVLDSCFSGNALPASRSNRNVTTERLYQRADYVFTSSASGQESYGYRDGSGGLFTTAFLDAIGATGSQGADTNQDGFTTLSEIEVAVKNRLDAVSSNYSFIMSPQVSSIGATSGEFFFINPGASIISSTPDSNIDNKPVDDKSGDAIVSSRTIDVIKGPSKAMPSLRWYHIVGGVLAAGLFASFVDKKDAGNNDNTPQIFVPVP